MTISRRTLLAGLAATPLLAACGTSDTPAAPAAGSSAPSGFRWTDGRGRVIDLPSVPTNVVAQSSAAAALWDAGFKVRGAYGELKTTDGKLDYQAGNLDLSQVQVIGSTYGEFSLEKLAAATPGLLIDLSFDDKTLWYVDAKVEQQVTALCPTLGVKMLDLNLVEVIESFTDLAVQLGADPAAAAPAKAGFEEASAALRTTIGASKGATITAFSFDADNAYVSNADSAPDLAYVKSLGGQFRDARDVSPDYFATISYEKLDDYAGDIVMVDARNTYKGYRDQPTWKALTAVKEGRVFEWFPAAPYSYAASVGILQGFGKAYASAG